MRGIDVDAGNPYSLWSDDFVWNGLRELSPALILKTVHGHIYSPLRDSTRHGKTDHAAKVEALKNMSCI